MPQPQRTEGPLSTSPRDVRVRVRVRVGVRVRVRVRGGNVFPHADPQSVNTQHTTNNWVLNLDKG